MSKYGAPWLPLTIFPPGTLKNSTLTTSSAAANAKVSKTFTVPTGKMWWLMAGGARGLGNLSIRAMSLEATVGGVLSPLAAIDHDAGITVIRLGVAAPSFYVIAAGDSVQVDIFNFTSIQDLAHSISFREFDLMPLT